MHIKPSIFVFVYLDGVFAYNTFLCIPSPLAHKIKIQLDSFLQTANYLDEFYQICLVVLLCKHGTFCPAFSELHAIFGSFFHTCGMCISVLYDVWSSKPSHI